MPWAIGSLGVTREILTVEALRLAVKAQVPPEWLEALPWDMYETVWRVIADVVKEK